tara:strand:+ start:9834 stop:10697 length:864 start_codon:yes stop_codon:yes gene_type:complete
VYRFTYHQPKFLHKAQGLFKAAEDPIFLAGGMTLVPTMKQHLATPTDVIDLAGLDELCGIEDLGDYIAIGAMTTHNAVAANPLVQTKIPALSDLAGCIGDNQVRNRGTLGGSIANSDPAADYPAALVALGARVITSNRPIAADDYFLDLFETALEPGEVVLRVEFPVPKRASYAKFRHVASGYAVVGVMLAEFSDSFRVGVTGAGPCAFRASGLEAILSRYMLAAEGVGENPTQALAQETLAAAHAELEAVEIPDVGFNSDIHASAVYRAHLIRVMTQRALRALVLG